MRMSRLLLRGPPMRRLVLTLALVCAVASAATMSNAATTREEASQLIKRFYERHPKAAHPTSKPPAGPSTKQPPATDVSSGVLGKRYVWFDNGRKMGVIAFGTGGFAYDDWLHVPQAWSVAPNGDLIVSSDSSRWVTRLTLDPATGRFSGGRDPTSKTQDGTRSELVPETPPSTATKAVPPPASPSGPPKVPGAATTLPAPTDTQQNPKVPVPPTATAPIPPQPKTTQEPGSLGPAAPRRDKRALRRHTAMQRAVSSWPGTDKGRRPTGRHATIRRGAGPVPANVSGHEQHRLRLQLDWRSE